MNRRIAKLFDSFEARVLGAVLGVFVIVVVLPCLYLGFYSAERLKDLVADMHGSMVEVLILGVVVAGVLRSGKESRWKPTMSRVLVRAVRTANDILFALCDSSEWDSHCYVFGDVQAFTQFRFTGRSSIDGGLMKQAEDWKGLYNMFPDMFRANKEKMVKEVSVLAERCVDLRHLATTADSDVLEPEFIEMVLSLEDSIEDLLNTSRQTITSDTVASMISFSSARLFDAAIAVGGAAARKADIVRNDKEQEAYLKNLVASI